MLTMDQREITGPGTGAHNGDGASAFRRILVRSLGESYHTVGVAARLCALADGVLRLVHVRTCDPPLPISGRFYQETVGEAAAVLKEALPMAWACGCPRATTAVVDARRGHVGLATAWQAAGWPADLIMLARPRPAPTRPLWGSIPTRSCAKRPARCSPPPGKPAAIWPATSCQTRLP
jgi:hypothetical protein